SALNGTCITAREPRRCSLSHFKLHLEKRVSRQPRFKKRALAGSKSVPAACIFIALTDRTLPEYDHAKLSRRTSPSNENLQLQKTNAATLRRRVPYSSVVRTTARSVPYRRSGTRFAATNPPCP